MSANRPVRVFYMGVASPPEEFLRRKFEALERAGVEVSVARDFFAALPVPRPDIVHFEWNGAAIDYLEREDVWRLSTVVSCRGTQLRVRPHVTPGYADQLRQTFRRATIVHCVCNAVRDEAVAIGLAREKAYVIYPAVDVEEFRPQSRRERQEPIRMLAIGALVWVKGYEIMLQSLRLAVDAGIDCHLEIIGVGDERARILFTIEDLGLEGRVSLRGAVAPREVGVAMRSSDLFLHTSVSEGISNAVLEAMASGLPVVTADAGGMREAVTHGIDGLVVPVRDPRAAASAIGTLARDTALRTRLAANARKTAETRFTLARQVEQWIALYDRAIASPRAG